MWRFFMVAVFLSGVLSRQMPALASDFTVVDKRVPSENEVSSNPTCNVRLSGPIVAGDAARLGDVLAGLANETSASGFAWGYTICLNSPGGSYQEGLAIAGLLLDRGLATMLKRGRTATRPAP
jgi:hypothetical protein